MGPLNPPPLSPGGARFFQIPDFLLHGRHLKPLPDGRTGEVVAITYGRARLIVSRHPDSLTYDDGW